MDSVFWNEHPQSRIPIFDMKNSAKNFFNVICSLQSHHKNLKIIKVITAVTVLKTCVIGRYLT